MAEPKRKFTPEFKLEAVRLATSGEKPLAQVARELGIAAQPVAQLAAPGRGPRRAAGGRCFPR